MKTLGLMLLILLAFVVSASAVGPTVTTNCLATWAAPTTHTDGSPIHGTLTYNLYIQTSQTPTPVPGTTPPFMANIVGTSAQPCGTLIAGQYYAWATAIETFQGRVTESSLSVVSPFVVGVPHQGAAMSNGGVARAEFVASGKKPNPPTNLQFFQ